MTESQGGWQSPLKDGPLRYQGRSTDNPADPFGNLLEFMLFWKRSDNSLETLRTVNETAGRWYLNYHAYQTAGGADYSSRNTEALCQLVALRGSYEKRMYECGPENLDFPKVGFNERFIDWLVLNSKEPFREYQRAILSVYMGFHALKALRIPEHPELGRLIEFYITNTPYSKELQGLWEILAASIPMPSKDENWKKIELLLKRMKRLRLEEDLRRYFDSEADVESEARTRFAEVVAQELYRNPVTIIDVGLEDKLGSYFQTAVKRDPKNILRTENRASEKTISASQARAGTEAKTGETTEEDLSSMNAGERTKDSKGEIEKQELVGKAKLTPTQEKVLEMRKLGGLSYKKIASELHISEASARNHFSKATAKLRESLKSGNKLD